MILVLNKISDFLKTREWLAELILGVLMALSIGYCMAHPSTTPALAVVGVLILVFSLIKIDWAVLAFVFLCPFHLVIKEIYPSVFTDLWRELFLLCILTSWCMQVCLMKLPLPRKGILNFVIVTYICWGAIEILRSYNLLAGVAGFRFMFAFVPVYFVVLSTLRRRTQIGKYVNVILASGFIIAVIAILQFILISLLGILTQGIAVDFARRYAARAAGIPFDRAVSVLPGPNELGHFLLVCLTFLFVFSYCSSENSKAHRRGLLFLLMIMLVALVFSMSRSSLIGFSVAIMSICCLTRKLKPILIGILGVTILFLIFSISIKALFKPIYTFSDLYFTSTLKREDLWRLFSQHPLIGHGFSITPSTAEKLGLSERGVLAVGGTDINFFHYTIQIGLIGFVLHFIIWLFFLRYSYLTARNPFVCERYRLIAIANFGILIGLMVGSVHTSPWEYVSISATYYVLGAISTFCYLQAGAVKAT